MTYKNAIILFLVFIIFSILVCTIKQISDFDTSTIIYIQNLMSNINSDIPVIAGGLAFYTINIVPLVVCCLYFLRKKMYKNMVLFGAIPFLTYFLNSIIKWIANRPRPPIELQFEEHMSSSSYVSRHTFITACLWGMLICFVCKYCKNNILKYSLISISVLWILFEGFSRVWMGVHNPTDVIGALILSIVFVMVYSRIL